MEKTNELVHIFDGDNVTIKTYAQENDHLGFIHEIEFGAENGFLKLALFDNVFTPDALRRWADTLEVSMEAATKEWKLKLHNRAK